MNNTNYAPVFVFAYFFCGVLCAGWELHYRWKTWDKITYDDALASLVSIIGWPIVAITMWFLWFSDNGDRAIISKK